jgi:DegV family protein with EDD domain
MKKRIIGDSCTDLNAELENNLEIEIVPLRINLGGKEFIDKKDFDAISFLEEMVEYDDVVKTSCPSPEDYLKVIDGDGSVFIVTLSKELSGSYNSAILAKKLYLEGNDDNKFIHVFNSRSAAVGQTLIALKIKELIDLGLKDEMIVEKVEAYIESQQTLFILESLDNLMKNGRISKTKGFIANTFNIIPIMGSTPKGTIELKAKGRGSKAYKKMIDLVVENAKDAENKILGITHVDNKEQAEKIKKMIQKKVHFKDIIIVDARGVSTSYADNKGIVIAF